MRWVLGVLALSLAVLPALGSAPVKKRAKHATSSASPIRAGRRFRPNAGHKGRATKGVRSGRMRGKGRARVAAAPSFQTHPDPERYQQIQQALAARGYFKGDANGQWQDDSVAALRRFQSDQQLESEGKIDALTLRDLGLGPKHDGDSTARNTPNLSGAPAELPPAPEQLKPVDEPAMLKGADARSTEAKPPPFTANVASRSAQTKTGETKPQ